MPIIIPSSSSGADALESFILDDIELNDGITLRVESVVHVPAAKRPEWISGADSDGALLADDPQYENCTWEFRVHIAQQPTMDAALAQIAAIEDKLQETSRNAQGLALVWTPADSALDPITWRALLGEITERPIDTESGYFAFSPVLGIRLTCLPLGYGTETLLGSVTSSLPLITLEVTGTGDVPMDGRLVVTDAASQARRWMAWSLESRWYDHAAEHSLLIDSASMTAQGGTTTTRSGAYSGASNNVIAATLRGQPQVICSLGNLSHVGEFRPQLRFYASATTMAVRLRWQALDGPYRALSYRVPVTAGWNHVDIGLVNIPQAASGTQRWTGQIEAVSTSADGGETCEVDYLALMPAEQFGRAVGTYAYGDGGILSGFDHFSGTTAAAALNGRSAPTGGTWATSGAATDFVFTDTPVEAVTRTTTADASPRYAILGSTNYTNINAAITTQFSAYGSQSQVLIVRWTDANNHLRIILQAGVYIAVTKVVGGVVTDIAYAFSDGIPAALSTWYTIHSVVFASGRGIVWLKDTAGAVILTTSFSDSVLATGGTLATGKPGFADYNNGSANTRNYDNMYVATPPAEPIVCHSGQSIEFRHDTVLREDSTGTYAGPPPEYVGSRFTIPNAGGPGRKTRVAVMAKRHDVESVADDYIADSTTVAVYGTPKYLVVPR